MTANRLLVLVIIAVLAAVVNTIPARGASLPAPKPPAPKLYIYPKLLPPQKGEEVIRDPRRPSVDTSKWA